MAKVHLDVKAASLAAETRIIRRKEKAALRALDYAQRAHKETSLVEGKLCSLQRHRTAEVRPEARATHLALAFMRGYSYRDIERFAYTEPNWGRIKTLVLRYGDMVDSKSLDNWIMKGKEWYNKSETPSVLESDPMSISPFVLLMNKWFPFTTFFGI